MYQDHQIVLSPTRLERLRSLTAQLDCAPGPGGSRCTDFEKTQAVYEPELRDLFPGRWTRAMVVLLYPSSQIVAHRDPPIEGRRFHIPLVLNRHCWVYHGGDWRQLREGVSYEMDPTVVHGAVNWGETVRMHLAIDVLE